MEGMRLAYAHVISNITLISEHLMEIHTEYVH